MQRTTLFGLFKGEDVNIMRNAMLSGTARPFPDEKVKYDLSHVATLLHEQMKLIPDYRLRIRTGETPVAWFLCAVHRIVAPRSSSFACYPQDDPKNVPLEQYAAMPPWFRDIKPDDPEEYSECNLPALHDYESLPLAYWEGLFYALAAEINYLYQDLKLRFGARFERGDKKILHDYGSECRAQNDPFSVVDFAHLLETFWEKIMSSQLITALDYAIQQRAAFVANGEVPTFYSMIRFNGLRDVTSMDPVQVARWLADKHATEVKVAVRTNVQKVTELLSADDAAHARREELEAQRKKLDIALAGPQSESSGVSTRTNTPVRQKQLLSNLAVSHADSSSQNSGTERPLPNRGRLVHKPSNLAYVVDKTPAPTDLYRDHSGQRYPQKASKPRAGSSATSPPTLEPQYHAYTTPLIPSKPLQPALAGNDGLIEHEFEESGRFAKVSMNTKPSTQEHTSSQTQPTSYIHASFDGVAHNHTFKLSSDGGMQSFPAFDDTRPLPPTPEYEQIYGGEQPTEDSLSMLKVRTHVPRARPSTSPTKPSPDLILAPRSNTLPTGPAPFGQHDQVTPIPRQDNTQQRYVSAGGNTPLHERAVMHDFVLPAVERKRDDTFNMHKDEMYTKLGTHNLMEEMVRADGARKASKASKASTIGSENKKKKSLFEGVRVPFSRKNSRNEESDQ
ncbi:hypothetical protein MBLNU13_g10138t1 [Cladosporium sp. NU13]